MGYDVPRNKLVAIGLLVALFYSCSAFASSWTPGRNVRIVQKGATSTNVYNTIDAALGSISNPSETNRFIVKIMAGTYDAPTTRSFAKYPFVDIEGSGPSSVITSAIASNWLYYENAPTTATVVMAGNSKLSNLTVQNTAATDGGIGILIKSANSTVEDVKVIASTANSSAFDYYGIVIWGSAATDAVLKNVTATASLLKGPGGGAWALAWIQGGKATIQNCTGIASGGKSAVGMYVQHIGRDSPGGLVTLKDSTFEGMDTLGTADGIYNSMGNISVDGCKATAHGSQNLDTYGIDVDYLHYPVTVTNSEIRAWDGTPSYGINYSSVQPQGSIFVGSTLIQGATGPCVSNNPEWGGVMKLINNWDGNFDPVTSCPQP